MTITLEGLSINEAQYGDRLGTYARLVQASKRCCALVTKLQAICEGRDRTPLEPTLAEFCQAAREAEACGRADKKTVEQNAKLARDEARLEWISLGPKAG